MLYSTQDHVITQDGRQTTATDVLRYLRGTCEKGIQFRHVTKLNNTLWVWDDRLVD
jgi:hypothetical protein